MTWQIMKYLLCSSKNMHMYNTFLNNNTVITVAEKWHVGEADL